ncbi:hypothetical protein CGLAMM_02850 [Acetobacteraceae bacterium EV16G]|uniref:Uncharacterized protein n=2 Tax=Sorlinia euscelidii TaxID=3081148 RepID=A0ABU7U1A7_9PROT
MDLAWVDYANLFNSKGGVGRSDEWWSSGVNTTVAAKWSRSGFAVEGYKECKQIGIKRPEILEILKTIFRYDGIVAYCPKEVIDISNGIDNQLFSEDDLRTFIYYLDQYRENKKEREFLIDYFDPKESDRLLSDVSKLHNGASIDQIFEEAVSAFKRNEAKQRKAQEDAQRTFQNRIKNAIGSEGVSLCGGIDTKRWPEFGYYLNPYAPVGKCYLTTIRYFMNGVQWLSREKLLVIQPLPPGLGYQQPILFKGSEPIRVGVEATVYGEEPETYESALGAVVNPTTYRVLGYLPLPIEEFNRR